MKVRNSQYILALGSLMGAAWAQNTVQIFNPGALGWTDIEKTTDDNGKTTLSEPSPAMPTVQTSSEMAAAQEEIVEYKKKFSGIYDPNMYPYGPLHGDYKAPGADDAVSDVVQLPSKFPFFGGKWTKKLRASTNGLIVLGDAQIFESDPELLPSAKIDVPFVAGFWNDIWSKKHGKIYWRLELSNTTLLSEIRSDIINGFPEFEYMGEIKYAFILSFWAVSYFGAVKVSSKPWQGDANTFQMVLATSGKNSFLINNYQELKWSKAVGVDNMAVAGYDIDGVNYDITEGSLTNAVLDWNKKSTNSDMAGRHIYRLDDIPPPEAPTTLAPPTSDPSEPTDTTTGPLVFDTVVASNTWEANDNTLGGGIYKYRPSEDIGNGTCTVQFLNQVAWFHVFDAHIRADAAVTANVWKLVAANKEFEPSKADGSFTFAIQFERGFEFTEEDINVDCVQEDDFAFAVYSFPQNHLQTTARTNIRKKDNKWDPTVNYAVTFPEQVANFTLDDGNIIVQTSDNQNFVLNRIPDTIEEVWFQFEYINYFGSNEVGVFGT